MIEIVGIAILCNMWSHWFQPIQKVKHLLLDGRIPDWMYPIFVCSKCTGFWVGLIYFQNPILAAITSLVSYLVDNLIYSIEIWKDKN